MNDNDRDINCWYQFVVANAGLTLWEYDIPARRIRVKYPSEFRFGMGENFTNVPFSILPYIAERSIDDFLEMFARIDAGLQDVSCEIWYNMDNATVPSCERVSYHVTEHDEAGKPVLAYGMSQDITAQKIAETQHNYIMERVVDDIDQFLSIFYLNLTKNSIIGGRGRGRGAELFQAASYDELLNQFYTLFDDSRELADFKAHCNRAAVLEAFQRGITSYSVNFRCKTRTHGVRWLNLKYVTNQNPLTGDIEVVCYSRDIQNQIIMDTVMKHLTNSTLECIAVLDLVQQRFFYVSLNEAAHQVVVLMEEDYDEEIRYVAEHFVLPEERDAYLDNTLLQGVLRHLEVERVFSYDVSLIDLKGNFCRKMLRYNYLDDEHHMIMMIAQDITEMHQRQQRQLEQLQVAMQRERKAIESKREFLSNISHDMRTPLNGIIGFTDLALTTSDEHIVREYLQKIKVSGGLLLDLINDTLMLSKLESGKLKAVYEVIDNRTISTRVLVPIKAAADKKQITLIADRNKSPQVLLWADRVNTQKIFLNLLSNAVKFTPPGGQVEILMERMEKPIGDCNYRFIVRDNGIGMSPEFIERMYEPFSQEYAPKYENTYGTGLGLAIVWQLVQLLNGHIKVKSELGKGTEFTVLLPLRIATAEEAAAASRKEALHTAEDVWIPTDSLNNASLRMEADEMLHRPEANMGQAGPKTILLCEDNPLNTEITMTILQHKGYEVICAENGEIGVALFKESQIDEFAAILMDLRMPVMNGYEAAKAIRKLDRPDAKTIPIIAVSADAYADDVASTTAAGMNAHCPKPLNPDVLIRILQKLV